MSSHRHPPLLPTQHITIVDITPLRHSFESYIWETREGRPDSAFTHLQISSYQDEAYLEDLYIAIVKQMTISALHTRLSPTRDIATLHIYHDYIRDASIFDSFCALLEAAHLLYADQIVVDLLVTPHSLIVSHRRHPEVDPDRARLQI